TSTLLGDSRAAATRWPGRISLRSTRRLARITRTASSRPYSSPSRIAIGRSCSNAGFGLDASNKETKRMSEAGKTTPRKKLTPADVLKGESPLVLTATLEPIVSDRFQPAGFPEIGHVIYKAPRKDGNTESVCIVDSAASMANHLESVCQRGAHDLDLVDELNGMPYIRCVTGDLTDSKLPSGKREIVVTSLTEGHRIA